MNHTGTNLTEHFCVGTESEVEAEVFEGKDGDVEQVFVVVGVDRLHVSVGYRYAQDVLHLLQPKTKTSTDGQASERQKQTKIKTAVRKYQVPGNKHNEATAVEKTNKIKQRTKNKTAAKNNKSKSNTGRQK